MYCSKLFFIVLIHIMLSFSPLPLKRVVHSVPAITDNFWEVVAEKLATGHTAEECGSEYFRMKGGRRGRRTGRATATGKNLKQQQQPTEKEGTLKNVLGCI